MCLPGNVYIICKIIYILYTHFFTNVASLAENSINELSSPVINYGQKWRENYL